MYKDYFVKNIAAVVPLILNFFARFFMSTDVI
jgi:hypothetical protein